MAQHVTATMGGVLIRLRFSQQAGDAVRVGERIATGVPLLTNEG